MKHLLVLCLLAFAACAGRQVAPGQLGEEGLSEMAKRTMRIDVFCKEGDGGGTGVLLGPDKRGRAIVATADHVARLGCETWVAGLKAEVVARDSLADVALLRVDAAAGIAVMREAPLYLGMPVVAMGYPLQFPTGGTGFQVTRGYLVAKYVNRMRVSASFYYGSSGGPAFDEQGRLVGLTVSGYMINAVYPVADQYIVTPAAQVFHLYERVR